MTPGAPPSASPHDLFQQHFARHLALAVTVSETLELTVEQAGHLLIAAFSSGHKVIFCGNGGSAADAQHVAADLTGRYEVKDRRALSALALSTDSSAVTSIANDLGYDRVFARQVTIGHLLCALVDDAFRTDQSRI